jgi:uncharacterized protein (UPF0335 family)
MPDGTASTEKVGGIAATALKQYVERIERLEEEKKALAEDIKQVYGEAKSTGFDTKILRKVISIRKKDPQQREEEDELLAIYLDAVGGE